VRIVIAMMLVLALVPASARAAEPVRLEAKIPLGAVAGRIDHMAFDLARKRLFVAELGNNSVGIVDVEARKVVHRLSGLKEPQGIAYLAARDLIYVANGGDGALRIYKGEGFAPAGSVALGDDADNIRLDPTADRIVVGYGKGALALIDPARAAKVADIPLKAHPESFQLDRATDRVFVNLPDAKAISVVSRATAKEVASWRVPYGGNFAMALDHDNHRALAVFRNPAKLVAFAQDDGKVLAETETCGDVDDLFLDSKRQRLYVSCGQGFLDVLEAAPPFRRLARLTTVSGARTSLFVPELDRLFLAVRAQAGQPAAIWVYAVGADAAGK
jgi:hypothetical protein